MKIIYKIKFTVAEGAKRNFTCVKDEIIDSPIGNLLARLYDQRYTNFISDHDIRTAVKALITDGKTLTITDESFGAIPYIPNNDPLSIEFYHPGGIESTVDIDVTLTEFSKYGRPLALVAYNRPILFVGKLLPSAKLMYSLAELRGVMDPDDKVQTVDMFTESHSDSLTRLFIKLLGTAYYYGTLASNTPAVLDKEQPKEAEATQSSIPNHLLHGHDEDPVIHPPVPKKPTESIEDGPVLGYDYVSEHVDEPTVPVPVSTMKTTDEDPFADLYNDEEEEVMGAPNYVDPMKGVKVIEPEPTQVKYPIKHEQVYRTAALSLSKLDLTAVIKAQRVMFPDSEYWKEITRAKLYEVLMAELMKECDWQVGMIDQGNGPFLDHNPHPLSDDHEKFPFFIHAGVSQEPGTHKQTYKFVISYIPLSTAENLEIRK